MLIMLNPLVVVRTLKGTHVIFSKAFALGHLFRRVAFRSACTPSFEPRTPHALLRLTQTLYHQGTRFFIFIKWQIQAR